MWWKISLAQVEEPAPQVFDHWHGSHTPISTKFDRTKSRIGGMVFTTPDREFANAYGQPYRVRAQSRKLYDADDHDEYHNYGLSEQYRTPESQMRLRNLAGELEDGWEEGHHQLYGITPAEHLPEIQSTDITDRIQANDPSWNNWHHVEDPGFINHLKTQGYDAVKMREHGSDTYGFFGDDDQVELSPDQSSPEVTS